MWWLFNKVATAIYRLVRRSSNENGACWAHHVARITHDLLAQIAMAETHRAPGARSQAGAEGLMQFMPRTWRAYGRGSPFNPDDATRAARIYLDYLQLFGGSLAKMLSAWNSGPNHVLRLIRRWGEDDWSYHLPPQTEHFVTTVLRGLDSKCSP
jgi:membrane-bound lytic murein transglycosylase MltF